MDEPKTPMRGSPSGASSPGSSRVATTTIKLPYSSLRTSPVKHRLYGDNDFSSRDPDVRRRAETRARDFSPMGRPRSTAKVRNVVTEKHRERGRSDANWRECGGKKGKKIPTHHMLFVRG